MVKPKIKPKTRFAYHLDYSTDNEKEFKQLLALIDKFNKDLKCKK